jgi:hypothetical protein
LAKIKELHSESKAGLEQLREEVSYLVGEIDNKCIQIAQLQNQIEELKKPRLFVGISEPALAGNKISNYYYTAYKYHFDCINWEETDTGYKILFGIRTNPGLTDKEVFVGNCQEQLAALTNSLHGTLPSFDFNRQNSTATLMVQLRPAIKKTTIEKLETDINKIWISSDKFESYVKNFERVRVTAGSTGGKSPTGAVRFCEVLKIRVLNHLFRGAIAAENVFLLRIRRLN